MTTQVLMPMCDRSASEWHTAVAGGQSISSGWLLLVAGVNALLTANAFGDDS